jgi:DNA repair exonuclease SbcCD nuclease subunit
MSQKKKTKKSITLSDAHIKKRSWVSRPMIQQDAYRAVEQVITLCIEHEASLKIAGDLFDVRTPESRDIKFFMDQMDRLKEAGLPVYAIQGNHDKTNDVPWFTLHDWVQWVDRKVFEPIEGFSMYGLDYRTRTELEEELADCPEVQGVMLHQGAKTILPFENSWDLDEEVLPDTIMYIDLGHVHTTQIWEAHGHKCSYPGSPYVTDIDLDPDRYVFLQEFVDGEIVLTPIELKTRGFVTVIIDEGISLEEQIKQGLNSLRGQLYVDPSMEPVLYLKYNTLIEGEIHSVVERVLDELDEKFYPWYAPCKPEQLKEQKEEVVLEDASVDELAHEEAESPELAEFVLGLLKGSASESFEKVRDGIFDDND